jgi:hypothetical protein
VKGSSTSQRTGPNGAWLLSASHVKKVLPNDSGEPACMHRWFWERLVGLKEPSSPAMEAGTAKHREMELWLLLGITPTSKAALKALKTTRQVPGSVEVETPVRFDYTDELGRTTCWLGFIDVWYEVNLEGTEAAKGVRRNTLVIQDWKFTSKLSNARTAAELQDDEAATIYAYEAYLGGAEYVQGRWVYVTQDGSSSKEVWFDLPRDRVEKNMRELHETGLILGSHREKFRLKLVQASDFAQNPKRCDDYRRPCHLLGKECTPPSPKRFSLSGAQPVTTFEERMANFPGAKTEPALPTKKAPPPLPTKAAEPALPVKKTPPPLPQKVDIEAKWEEMKKDMPQRTDDEIGKVQGPPINSPEVEGVTPPRNPEEAAAMQGEKKPEPPPPDDLDAMDRKALKALGQEMGLWGSEKSARDTTLRGEIRHARKLAAEKGEVAPLPSTVQAEVDAVFERIEELRIRKAAENVTSNYPADIPHVGAVEALKDVAVFLEQPAPASVETPKESEFLLLINCDMVGGVVPEGIVRQHALVSRAEQFLGVPDFRLIDFGKGPGELACAVRQILQEDTSICGAVIDTRTAAGSALVDVLSQHATLIVRGN